MNPVSSARMLAPLMVLLFAAGTAAARVNLLEPWQPGQDMTVARAGTVDPSVALLRGERVIEVPLSLTVPFARHAEAGARWGLRRVSDTTGIGDFAVAAKYTEPDVIGGGSAVCAEAGATLPTGDADNDMGPGAVAFLLHWTAVQDLRPRTGEPVTASLGFGFVMNGENSDEVQQGNVFWYHAGASYAYNAHFLFHAELKGFNHGQARVSGSRIADSDYQELYIAPGVDLTLAGGRVLSGALLLGLTPESHDVGIFLSTRL